MKKRRVLKGWVEKSLITIEFILFMILGIDTPNTSLFIVSKLITITSFIIITFILGKYSRLLEC